MCSLTTALHWRTHASAHTHTHTHTMLVPVMGLKNFKCKLIRGCSITVSSGLMGGGGQFLSRWSGCSSRSTIRGGPMNKFLSWSGAHNYHLQWISCPSLSEMGLNSCHRSHKLQMHVSPPWRYTTHSGCVFYSPLYGFSLLPYDVTSSHTATLHSR